MRRAKCGPCGEVTDATVVVGVSMSTLGVRMGRAFVEQKSHGPSYNFRKYYRGIEAEFCAGSRITSIFASVDEGFGVLCSRLSPVVILQRVTIRERRFG